MKRALVVSLIVAAGCRNVLGISAETTVEVHSITGMVRGAAGNTMPVDVMLRVDGVLVETQTFTDDLTFTFSGIPNQSGFEITASPGCTVTNGTASIQEVDVTGVLIQCEGELTLKDFGFSAPLDVSPGVTGAVTEYAAIGSYLTTSTGLAPAAQRPETAVSAYYQNMSVGAGQSFATQTGHVARVETSRGPGTVMRTYRAILNLDGLPAQFGFGKPDTATDGEEFGTVMHASTRILAVGLPNRGAGEVLVFVRSGQRWEQRAKLSVPGSSELGASVYIQGNAIFVGAPGNDAVYEFTTMNGTTFPQAGVLNGPPGSRFGESVGASTMEVAVGAPAELGSGRVHVYRRTDRTELLPVLSSTGPLIGDRFGAAIAMNETFLLVGSPGADQGGSLVNAGTAFLWQLSPSMMVGRYDAPDPDANDQFGAAVALDSTTILWPKVIIGAPYEDSSAATSGAVYVYTADPATVAPTIVKSPNPDAGDAFGWSLAVSGSLLAVGSPFEDSATRGVAAGATAADEAAQDAGAAYVFDLANLSLKSYFKASDPRAGDRFGTCVSVTVDSMVVSAPSEDSSALGWNGFQDGGDSDDDRGAVYTFR